MSRFPCQLRNELGRRYTRIEHLRALTDYEPRLATIELLKFAKELEGRPKLNSLYMLFRHRSVMTDEEHSEFVDQLVDGGPECVALRETLVALDGMLRQPRLSKEEKARLASEAPPQGV